jgi:hypothetical protein
MVNTGRNYTAVFILLVMAASAVSCVKFTFDGREIIWYQQDPNSGDDEIVMENDFLEFRFFPQTTEFTLTDKAAGTVWRSNPEGAAGDPLADALTRQVLQSQFNLVYSSETGSNVSMNNIRYGVTGGFYRYEIVDGGLEVSYTVTDATRIFYIPIAITQSRFEIFLGKLSAYERGQIELCYRLHDINNLALGQNRNDMLALYPDLRSEKVWIMKTDMPAYMKGRIYEFLTAAGYTYEDYEADEARHNSSLETSRPVFNVTLRYELDGKALLVRLPFDRLAYPAQYPIIRLDILPYFGAGSTEDSGYMLVPDGSGALIRFNNGMRDQTEYNSYIYGWDLGIYRESVVQDNRSAFPVYGIQKNGETLLCIIEDGAAYASVRADISGRNSSYNNVHSQYTIIRSQDIGFSTKINQTLIKYQNGPPRGEGITLRYIPGGAGGYVDMAKEYRAYLLERYPELDKNPSGSPHTVVEIIGAVSKPQQRLGIPMDLPLKLTSYREARSMVEDFASLGWNDVSVKIIGWFNGSVNHAAPSSISFIGELGGRRDFLNLTAAADRLGYPLYAEGDFLYMRNDRLFDGFSRGRDSIRSISGEIPESYPYSYVWFGLDRFTLDAAYIARPEYMRNLILRFSDELDNLNVSAVGFRNIGSGLAADYYERRFVSREASMNMQRETMAELKDKGKSILIKTGFTYAVPYADLITDMALGDQRFGITDTAVPFYEIVLHGLVPYTGNAINLAEDYTLNILKTIETGAGLYFSFMTETAAVLQETVFRRYFSNQYDEWKMDADALYKTFLRDFDGLYNQQITGHEILDTGVTVTEYEDGSRVIVNTGPSPYQYGDLTVGAYNYAVSRRGGSR